MSLHNLVVGLLMAGAAVTPLAASPAHAATPATVAVAQPSCSTIYFGGNRQAPDTLWLACDDGTVYTINTSGWETGKTHYLAESGSRGPWAANLVRQGDSTLEARVWHDGVTRGSDGSTTVRVTIRNLDRPPSSTVEHS